MKESSNDNYASDVDLSLYILNEKNKLITTNYIENILQKYGVNHKVKNLEPFQMAMVHISYLIKSDDYWKAHRSKNTNKDLEPISDPSLAIPLKDVSYERLEFLGDSVIHKIIAAYLYNRYPDQDEGFLTKLRTKIENGNTLAEFSKIIGLDEYILISRYIEKNGGRENNKHILEDAFEAFIGALYLDAGDSVCHNFIFKLIEEEIDFADLLNNETNYKDILLQYFHQRKWVDPQYGPLDISGPDHKKIFTMYVKKRISPNDDGEIVGIGVGTSKKKGEQEAAYNALKFFNRIHSDDDSESYDEFSEDFTEEELSEDI